MHQCLKNRHLTKLLLNYLLAKKCNFAIRKKSLLNYLLTSACTFTVRNILKYSCLSIWIHKYTVFELFVLKYMQLQYKKYAELCRTEKVNFLCTHALQNVNINEWFLNYLFKSNCNFSIRNKINHTHPKNLISYDLCFLR